MLLSDVNRLLHFYEEGTQQANEALEIFERIGNIGGQTHCLNQLAWLLFDRKQLNAAESAASRAIDLVSEEGQEFLVCKLHRVLGCIHDSKGEKKKAIHHFETALRIASPFNWHEALFWIHYDLAELSCGEGEFDNAHAYIKLAKLHAGDDPYQLGRAIRMRAEIWYQQRRLEDAKSEALNALGIFEKSGAVNDAEICRDLLQIVEREMANGSTSV